MPIVAGLPLGKGVWASSCHDSGMVSALACSAMVWEVQIDSLSASATGSPVHLRLGTYSAMS